MVCLKPFLTGLFPTAVGVRSSLFSILRRMSTLKINNGINKSLSLSTETQVMIVGKCDHMKNLHFGDGYSAKLSGFVNDSTWETVRGFFSSSSQSVVPLYLNLAWAVSIADTASRHNSPSNCLAICKEVKKISQPEGVKNVSFVLLSSYEDVFPSVAALSRCFPLFSRTTNSKVPELIEIDVVVTDGRKLVDKDMCFLQTVTEAIRTTARLIDTPVNELNTKHFVHEAAMLLSEMKNVESVFIEGEELEKKGFGGIYNVGKASLYPPIFACFSYKPEGASKTYALVGKGIVYDTGGMQIKTKTVMPGMKNDMGGAAALLTSFYTLVKLGFKQNLHVLLCVADNNISPSANRPDDIITMLSGKTVEISNTDAEGRLVLADGVFYAKSELKADTIIDMATLTGAQGYATGKLHAAVLTNSEEWEKRACAAGRASGDLVHPLPFCPDLHFSDLKSPVADMRNSNFGKMKGPPSSIAGLFIAAHIDFAAGIDWIHFDVAYPVENSDRATGYGPALISALLAPELDVPLLQEIKC